MTNNLEICTDASIKTFTEVHPHRTFGCAGALCITTMEEEYLISQDTTNNRSELLGVYLGLKLGKKLIDRENGLFDRMTIYSDSQFVVFGLTRWMNKWMKSKDNNGIMYGTNGKPVANQELFMCILSYITSNNLKVSFKHCSGHVSCNSSKALRKANDAYYISNGEYLRPEDIYKISYYNNIIDMNTRERLNHINPSLYPIMNYSDNYNMMTKYVVPDNYKDYIGE